MEEKITIIEGPTPVFEEINDSWAVSLNESPILFETLMTQVRTLNGPSLVERCHRAWNKKSPIYLHYRNEDGLEEKAPIIAARSVESDQGHILLLWLRQLPTLDDLKDLEEDFKEDFEDELDDDEEDSEDSEDGDEEEDSGFGFLN